MQKTSKDRSAQEMGLHRGKVLVILGNKDPIVVEDELAEDASEVLGWDNVRFDICDAGHELPITESKAVLNAIWKFWEKDEGSHWASE